MEKNCLRNCPTKRSSKNYHNSSWWEPSLRSFGNGSKVFQVKVSSLEKTTRTQFLILKILLSLFTNTWILCVHYYKNVLCIWRSFQVLSDTRTNALNLKSCKDFWIWFKTKWQLRAKLKKTYTVYTTQRRELKVATRMVPPPKIVPNYLGISATSWLLSSRDFNAVCFDFTWYMKNYEYLLTYT